MPNKKFTRILSIDGGGIRGIIPGTVLIALEKKLQQFSGKPNSRLADYFDLIAGTSTGGILTCCYLIGDKNTPDTVKYSAEEVVNLYLEHGEDIFKNDWFHKIKSGGGITDEKYSNKGLKKVLNKYMGDSYLKDLVKPTLITAYDIEKRKAHFFTQHDAHKSGSNFLVRDVAQSTGAAPTYFECARIQDDLGRNYTLVDGGLFANNPTLCAYAEARNLFKKEDSDHAVTASDMIILSLGTGTNKKVYPYEKAKDWGLAGWVKPVIDIMMSGVSETVDYQVRQIYDAIEKPDQYLRIEAKLPKTINSEMDDASSENMKALKQQGETLAERFDEQLNDIAQKLCGATATDKLV